MALAARQSPTVRDMDEKVLREYAGVYHWAPDSFVYLQLWNEFSGFDKPGQLVSFDESGEIRVLYPADRDQFFAGPGAAISTSVESRIDFQRDGAGKIVSLGWRREGAVPRTARRVEIERHEDVGFSNGEIRLAGTLMSPATAGKHPAIILVHGSGAENREYMLPWARFLIRRGMAVLGYDKRGVGASTGDWNTASFDDLAGDVVAAFEYLKTRSDIDRTQIGVLGISQAGWIMPLAAVRAKDLAFLISISGAGVPAAETTIDQARNEMTMAGMPPQAVEQIVSLLKIQYEFARTGKGWDDYAAAREKIVARMGRAPDSIPGTPDHPYWQFIRRLYFYDPVPTSATPPNADARVVGGAGQQHTPGQEQGCLGGGPQGRREPRLHLDDPAEGEPCAIRGEGRQQRGSEVIAAIRAGLLDDHPGLARQAHPGLRTGPVVAKDCRAGRLLDTPCWSPYSCY